MTFIHERKDWPRFTWPLHALAELLSAVRYHVDPLGALTTQPAMSSILLVVGLYMLYEASLNKSSNETGILLGGAFCFSLSLITLVTAVRSILWHRHMLRHAMPDDPHPDASGADHKA
jgi:hypothetical protein